MCLPLRALIYLLLALPLHLPAQQRLATARQRSYLTKVFRLTDAQTRQLYETDLTRARPEFFTQPVDSFPTDSAALGRRRPLPPGYYLVAHTEGVQLVYWLRAVTDRQITLLDNQIDLTLLVRDSLGRLLEVARVSLPKGQLVPFDAATRTYRLPGKADRAGLLAVEHAGRTTFHALGKRPAAHVTRRNPIHAALRLPLQRAGRLQAENPAAGAAHLGAAQAAV